MNEHLHRISLMFPDVVADVDTRRLTALLEAVESDAIERAAVMVEKVAREVRHGEDVRRAAMYVRTLKKDRSP